MVLSDLASALVDAGVTLDVLDGQLRARPRPPAELHDDLRAWRDFLVHAHAAHRAGRGLGPHACTECGEVTLTKPTKRTKDGHRFMGGPPCRFTPDCDGRHDTLIVIPWRSPA